MTSRGFEEPLIKCYEQILNFIIQKLKSYFSPGIRIAKFIDGKRVSVPPKRSEVFQKNSIGKAGF